MILRLVEGECIGRTDVRAKHLFGGILAPDAGDREQAGEHADDDRGPRSEALDALVLRPLVSHGLSNRLRGLSRLHPVRNLPPRGARRARAGLQTPAC